MNEETNTEFKAVIPAMSLKAVLKVIASVDDEAVLKVTPDGISVVMSDCVNASMIDMTLDKSAFLRFKNINFYELEIDVDRLMKMLVIADDLDMVTLERSADEKNMIISFGYFRYELELLTGLRRSKVPMPSIPDTESVSIEAVSDEFARIGVGVDGEFFMEAVGVEGLPKRTNKVSMVIPPGALGIVKRRTSLYSLGYLQGISEVVPYNGAVNLEIATDQPLLVTFKCCDGGRVKYMISPRIEMD
jgi:hypothetical protein